MRQVIKSFLLNRFDLVPLRACQIFYDNTIKMKKQNAQLQIQINELKAINAHLIEEYTNVHRDLANVKLLLVLGEVSETSRNYSEESDEV